MFSIYFFSVREELVDSSDRVIGLLSGPVERLEKGIESRREALRLLAEYSEAYAGIDCRLWIAED